ncbi:hypothetical protein BC827DRAFT_1153767 [Russula dissimulans]|nr:hypothetical protein BC827DRAFT_1153767 [Russula dissimulans]
MANIDLPGFVMTVLAFGVMVFGGWWCLLPRIVVPRVAGRLNEVSALFDRGEPVPNEAQFRMTFISLDNRFRRLRRESHRAPGSMHQLVRIFAGLTCRLYILWLDINSFQREVEVSQLAMDERQLAALDVAGPASPPPSAGPWFLQRLGRIFAGLIPLYVPWRDMNTFQRDVQLAMDEQQLAALNAAQNMALRVLPGPATNTAAPANDVAEPARPPPAAEP